MKIYKYKFLVDTILESQEETIEKIIQNKKGLYETFGIKKKQGVREIHALKRTPDGRDMEYMQKRLYRRFFRKIPIAVPAKGFVKKESYTAFLQPHLSHRFFMRIDITDFFHSFSEGLIKEILREHIKEERALDTVFELCTVDNRLPQGAVTSPVLSNIIFRRIDQRILKYCQSIEERQKQRNNRKKEHSGSVSLCYTRYADDLLFSSDFLDFGENMYFYHMISNILEQNGFRINVQKTIVCKDQLSMNGYVVGESIHLSRNKLKNLKRILYYFSDKTSDVYKLDKKCLKDRVKILADVNKLDLTVKSEKKTFGSMKELTYYLAGYRSWLISFLQIGENSDSRSKEIQKLVRRIEMLLDKLQELEG